MKKVFTLMVAAWLVMATMVHAHSIWINSFECHAHQPGHVMVNLGWGHALPMDDILNSVNGRIALETFELIDPSLAKTDLLKPGEELAKAEISNANFDVYPADLASQKIALKKESAKGVYQLAANSKTSFFTQYIGKDGKPHVKTKAKDEIEGIEKVLMAVKYQAFAKSYITLGEWTNPKPLGHGLEIIPRTDMSNLHVGDLVEMDVLFYGKPLTVSAKSMEFITAHSSAFGQSDGFSLFSYIMNGKAQFRVQSSGQWMISVNHKDDVTPDGPLKDLVGKAEQVYHGASLTFTVK